MNWVSEIREVGDIRDWFHIRFGRWWWIMFEDGSAVGPMTNASAFRMLDDAPDGYRWRAYVKWSREVPA
jgi:hypothetical protein